MNVMLLVGGPGDGQSVILPDALAAQATAVGWDMPVPQVLTLVAAPLPTGYDRVRYQMVREFAVPLPQGGPLHLLVMIPGLVARYADMVGGPVPASVPTVPASVPTVPPSPQPAPTSLNFVL